MRRQRTLTRYNPIPSGSGREIEVQTVNTQTGSLTYPDPEDRSRHVIAIGGLALSRGLTEGLSITYILRNASASDTLMQMGRWFVIDRVIKIRHAYLCQKFHDHYCSIILQQKH